MTARNSNPSERARRAATWQQRVGEARSAALLRVAAIRDSGTTLKAARAIVSAELRRDGVGTESALKRWGRAVRGAPPSRWPAMLRPELDRATARKRLSP